jgi:hypothetical protein
MNIFGNKDEHRVHVDTADRKSEDFKLFVESKMAEPGFADRFSGYTEDTVLSLLEKEFSMYKDAAPNKKGKVTAAKSKIPSFPSIGVALKTSEFGTKFTTPQSDRIYVVTRGTWGDKSDNKVVKGFTAGTDSSEIDKYSKRTKVKHGGAGTDSLPTDWRTPSMSKGKFKHGK